MGRKESNQTKQNKMSFSYNVGFLMWGLIYRPFIKSSYQKNDFLISFLFSYFSTKICVVGTQKNRLNEAVLLRLKIMGKKKITILR